jgi:hypothetical protein
MTRWPLFALLLASAPALAKPPRLTVFISVDALGADLLARSRYRLKGGIGKLANDGAYFPAARFGFAETVTAAGHATLATGANPWRHGIVSNRVINRYTGKSEAIFADASHPVLEAPLSTDDVSPLALQAETLSDRLRLSSQGQGKSIAIAGKARAAIALAGRLGQAWWFHEGVGKWVTGTYYVKEFPAWVKAVNDKRPADGFFGKEWALTEPKNSYLGDDDRPFESDWYGMGRTFPHPLSGGLTAPGPQSYQAAASSPNLNDLTVAFARAAIEGEGLGKDEQPDLLSISFSALDRIYHLYGPYSWEVQDALIRLDKAVGELITAAEKAAGGKNNLLVVLSADHGGAAIPEEWAAAGMPGVRINPAQITQGLNKELQSKFGGGEWIAGIEEIDLYLNSKTLAEKKVDGAAVRRAAAAWLASKPAVAIAVARDDLNGVDPSAGLLPALRFNYFPERSGDVLFVLKPFHVLNEEPAGTTHGTPYAYDAQVPVILLGKGVRPGYYRAQIDITDLAPTVAALMEMGAPALAEGSPRAEALNANK